MLKVVAVLPDLLLITGSALVSYGAYLVHPALGFVVGGALLILAGAATARAQSARKQ